MRLSRVPSHPNLIVQHGAIPVSINNIRQKESEKRVKAPRRNQSTSKIRGGDRHVRNRSKVILPPETIVGELIEFLCDAFSS